MSDVILLIVAMLLPALQNRLHAIEQVQQGLTSLPDKSQLLEQLPDFVDFLVQLLQDHNFKVAIAGLNILADLAANLGTQLQPHFRCACQRCFVACNYRRKSQHTTPCS